MKIPLVLLFSTFVVYSAKAQVCESEQSAVDTCFVDQCAECEPINLQLDVDESTQLSDLENSLTFSASTAKDCCPDCSDEVDSLISCYSPTLCVNDLCLGADNGSAATIHQVSALSAAAFGLVATLLV